MAKRIMQEFALDEISAVTKPAQKGARMIIMKRDDSGAEGEGQQNVLEVDKTTVSTAAQIAATVEKGWFQLTTAVNSHTHLIELNDMVVAQGGGYTSSYGDYDSRERHSHPFTIGDDGVVTIGEVMGHTHAMADPAAAASAIGKLSTENGDIDMDAAQLAKLERVTALAEMNDAQKAHFGKLDASGQEAFIKLSGADREQIVKDAIAKASEADPVVYTAANGAVYRKSDDPRLIQIAKDHDADKAALKAAEESRLDAEAVTLAKSWTHMSGTVEEKTAKAKAILAASPEVKKAALDSIAEHAKLMAPLFKNIGAQGGIDQDAGVSAAAKLDALANARAEKTNENFYTAYDKVLQTPEGARLYQETRPSRH